MPSAEPIDAVAPLRISFVGGGTDFPHWYEEHGGAVVSATIDHVVRVRITPRTDRVVEVRSLDLDRLVAYHLDEGPVYDGALDLVKAAIADAGTDVGMSVEIRSEAPPGSGLGGSSALGDRDGRRSGDARAVGASTPLRSPARRTGSSATTWGSAAVGRISTRPPGAAAT